jgi:NAD+ kinase
MSTAFHHAALIGKPNATGSRDMIESVGRFLRAQGLKVSVESRTSANTGLVFDGTVETTDLGKACDLAVVVGGDGTMLGIARELAPCGTPLIGINQGRLGFITDVPMGSVEATLPAMLRGDFVREQRSMLQGVVWRGEQRIFESMALNDVVISRGPSSSMLEVSIHISQEFVANVRADGLIVGSPTGSTAYALSAGGPILHPGIKGWLLVPIAPHDLSNRPIVVPDSGEIRIEVVAGRDVSVNFDMHGVASLLPGDVVSVQRSVHEVKFLHPREWSYYATLRRKLHWNSGGS